MSTRRETSAPRLAGGILCAAASLMLLLSSFSLYAGEAGVWGAGPLLVIGLWLLWVALKSLSSPRAS